jgi:protein-tyrosine sulfotransferase
MAATARGTIPAMETSRPGETACDSPVFVLTSSRSGSTLLRFILDSHPELACPPETTVASSCASLLRSWAILEEAGSEGRALHDSGEVPAAGIAVVQSAIDGLFSAYLRRRGKRRWCDKSLDSHMFAGLLAQAYPKAKFICLYRHCMDVIASGTEACPWGLHRFGFDPYVAQYSGNNVAAIGAYWNSCVQEILQFEKEHAASCHRIRYEDLVTAPEQTAAAMFAFLEVAPVPGITRDCFKVPHESNGPGDEKIWFTDQVTPTAVGRGVRVPVGALPPPLLQEINEALGTLSYRQIGPEWNEVIGPFDPRADAAANGAGAPGGAASPEPPRNGLPAPLPEAANALRALAGRLSARTDEDLAVFAARWPTLADQTLAMVVDGNEPLEHRWSLPARTGEHGGETAEPVAKLIAGPAVWASLLGGETNIVSELTAGRLRCVNKRDAHRLRSEELHAITWLLGLTQIPVERTPALAASEP